MVQTVQKTIIRESDSNTPVSEGRPLASGAQTNEYIVYFIFGAVNTLLAFRLILKLMGASTASTFVRFIYGMTGVMILPFEGIFRRGVSAGIETASILEPAVIVAIIVYGVIAFAIVKLITIFSGERQVNE